MNLNLNTNLVSDTMIVLKKCNDLIAAYESLKTSYNKAIEDNHPKAETLKSEIVKIDHNLQYLNDQKLKLKIILDNRPENNGYTYELAEVMSGFPW